MSKPHELSVRIDGEETLFEETLSPVFLELPPSDDLVPVSDVDVQGRVYKADEWVVVEGSVEASLSLPCATCNDRTEFRVSISPWELNLPVHEVKHGVLDLTGALREAILLEVPFVIKCGGEECRNRESVSRYLVSEEGGHSDDGEERNQPFRSLL